MDKDRTNILTWLRKAPFDDPIALEAQPDFSYENWINEGRKLPRKTIVLIELLEHKEYQGDGERIAFALGELGDQRAIPILMKSIETTDTNLRIESVSALGKLKAADASNRLVQILKDNNENSNVRANAAIAIGRINAPGSDNVLKQATQLPDTFIASSAEEGLRLLNNK